MRVSSFLFGTLFYVLRFGVVVGSGGSMCCSLSALLATAMLYAVAFAIYGLQNG